MKIKEITIQQYGVWRDLNLPLGDSNFSLFYGPNEAGKTTLMRFVRGLLYGYKPFHEENRATADGREEWDGTLHIEQNGELLKVRRRWRNATRGKVTVKPNHADENDKQLLRNLLYGIDESVFENVYALGLEELQKLATLNREEVAEQIYGISLGPEGELLRSVAGEIAKRKQQLLSPDGKEGQIASFLNQQDRIQKEVSLLNIPLHKHRQLGNEQQELKSNIRNLQQQQKVLETELRGGRLMEKIYDPWKQVQEYKREIHNLASLKSFPVDGLSQLRALEKEINKLTREREQLLSSPEQKEEQSARFLNDENLLSHEPTIRSLFQMRDWFHQIKQDGDKAGSEHHSQRDGLQKMVSGWGEDWSLERLDKVNVSPENHYQLLKSAQQYQKALGSWGRLRKRYKLRIKTSKQRETELEGELKQLEGLSVEAALERAKQHLTELEELGTRQLNEAHLASREEILRERIALMNEYQEVPRWVQTVLWVFGIFGIFFFLWGMYEWFFKSNPWNYRAIAGAIYAMVGLMTGGIAWAMRNHYGSGDAETIEQYRFQYSQIETELRETREQIARLSAKGTNAANINPAFLVQQEGGESFTAANLVQQATRNIASLEELSLLEERAKGDRRRLSKLRGRFKSQQQKVSDTRQEWCALLRKLGLDETVKINEAFQNWQGLLEAETLKQNLGSIKREQDVHYRIWDSIGQRIGQVAQQIGDSEYDSARPLEAVAEWNKRLLSLDRQKAERDRLRQQADKLQFRINELEKSLSKLLSQGGVSTRKEFKERAASLGRHEELQELLTIAEQDLQEVASQESEIAIVEEDLKKFDLEENRSRLSLLMRQQAEIEKQLQQKFLSLGTLEQKLKALEEDRRWSRLRLERAQVREQLNQKMEQFLGLQLAEGAMSQARSLFEKTNQPEILVGASKYLSSLTEGKHRNVWTPLDKRRLSIDDNKGRSLRVEELSSGTREQLFLAIRLALVDRYRKEGIKLPMVLDDILVNFDQARTEAAVETLKNYSQSGQQILFFTCHQHLAKMFDKQGANRVPLPTSQKRKETSNSISMSLSDSSLSSSSSDRDRDFDSTSSQSSISSHSSRSRLQSNRTSRTDSSSRYRDQEKKSDRNRNRDREYERSEGRKQRSKKKGTKKLKWYLDRNDPVVDAPSIGTKTAKLLKRIGIKTVDDLLSASPGEIARQLKTKQVKEKIILEWQQQAILMCRIPQIRGHDAQILVGVDVTQPKTLAAMNPSVLLSMVEPFVKTSAGGRIVRSGRQPDLAEVTDWIAWAQLARPLEEK